MIAEGAYTAEWLSWAACAEVDPDSFFPDGTGACSTHEYKMARRFCSGCPVREECLELALSFESHGIWGGTNELDRRVIRAERRRAAA